MNNNFDDFDRKIIRMFKTAFITIMLLIFCVSVFVIWALITLIEWVTTK